MYWVVATVEFVGSKSYNHFSQVSFAGQVLQSSPSFFSFFFSFFCVFLKPRFVNVKKKVGSSTQLWNAGSSVSQPVLLYNYYFRGRQDENHAVVERLYFSADARAVYNFYWSMRRYISCCVLQILVFLALFVGFTIVL